VAGLWFSPCTPVSSTNKTDRHDITEILLKVALNTITQIRWLDRLVKIVYEISCMIFSFRFYLNVMVSEINRVKGSEKGPTIKMIIFDCKSYLYVVFSIEFLRQISV
jgi:hypothetical protein